ncbi:MAG: FAD-dependent oxidoreductase, partial [Nitrospinota bacterium]
VKYVRSRPSSIKEIPATKNLKLRYVENGEVKIEEFDMVVLSLGLQASEEGKELAGTSNVELNEYGFITASDNSPVETSRPGIYACGTFLGPKDIPETVVEASAGASQAMTLLSEKRGSLITHKEYVAERDVKGEEPRIGVFVCHCGKNIGGVADVPDIVAYAKTLPNVVHAEDNLYTCSVDTQGQIKKMVVEKGLNRVIVASCTPRTHESLFRNTCREAGLNEYLFELANIRDQNTWVHMLEPAKATKKGKDIIRMAAAKSRLLEPLYRQSISISHAALVVGGGMSGMTAALNLADQGFEVHLVEMEAKLGGHFRHIYSLFDGRDTAKMLQERIDKVGNHSKINLYLSSKITAFAGSSGNFSSSITSADGTTSDIIHGVVIVASGADEYRPTEYLYGTDDRVITQHRLEDRFRSGEIKAGDLKSVTMIQCVGSREPERPYCSRICCQQAIKNALVLKEKDPNIDISILYRDIRTYEFTEKYYTLAREKGVRFIRYNEDNKPQVSNEGEKLSVNVYDDNLGDSLSINPDLLVLAPAIVHRDNAEELNQLFKVSLTQEKFFLEAHMKLRPIDFATEGIFMCGLAHAPKTSSESIAQALGAASRAATILSKDKLELEAAISEVVNENCDGCAYCIDPCPFDALTLIEYMSNGSIKKTVERDEVRCQGCGI